MHELPLSQKKVNELTTKCKHFNIFPIDLPFFLHGEDRHPVNGLIVELVNECRQYLEVMTKDEINSLVESLPPGIRMFIERYSMLDINAKLEKIAVYYLAALIQRDYFSFKNALTATLRDSKVLKVYPALLKRIDGDGLLEINDDMRLFDGGIEYRDHILHYSQFLRRHYTSNPNFDFTGRLGSYYYKTRSFNKFRISIDHARIMPKEFYGQIMEFDTWYGPTFDREKLDDLTAIGLTIMTRNKNSLFELDNHLDRTEFYWSFRDGIKTLQIEELSNIGYLFEHYYFNKYVHSERDINKKILQHLDGAIKVYLKDDYAKRFETRMPNESKSYKKIKLFRIDGDIDVDSWLHLISFFYKGNEMIIEYFNPEEFKELFEERVRDFKAWQEKQSMK